MDWRSRTGFKGLPRGTFLWFLIFLDGESKEPLILKGEDLRFSVKKIFFCQLGSKNNLGWFFILITTSDQGTVIP